MSCIELKDIRIYAHHGCLSEEEKIGSQYLVDLMVACDLAKASKTDALEDTIDYVGLHAIVKEQMAVRAKLLETVGDRIINAVLTSFPGISSVRVTVSKLNPPIGGDVKQVSVTMTS
ncbi:dihydroneopterin aldolase [Flavobacteriaceae bacterium]|nr:dihydroneopterin aldolase [Flavobacteriaceae bacterium]